MPAGIKESESKVENSPLKGSAALNELLPFLSCPLDQGRLERGSKALVCTRCRKQYPIHGDNFVALMPESISFRHPVSQRYQRYYQQEIQRKFTWMKNAKAWQGIDRNPASWVVKRLRQVSAVRKLLPQAPIVCDISAGAGHYTLELCKIFPLVIHYDLSVVNINDVYRQKQAQNIDNLVIIRGDYFKLPFKNTLPLIICMDTLVRGRPHEKRLLDSLLSAVSETGSILADFHNWWHNPLRPLGILPNNFETSYSRDRAEILLREAGIEKWNFQPFRQEFPPDRLPFYASWVPPTRLMYLFKKP